MYILNLGICYKFEMIDLSKERERERERSSLKEKKATERMRGEEHTRARFFFLINFFSSY